MKIKKKTKEVNEKGTIYKLFSPIRWRTLRLFKFKIVSSQTTVKIADGFTATVIVLSNLATVGLRNVLKDYIKQMDCKISIVKYSLAFPKFWFVQNVAFLNLSKMNSRSLKLFPLQSFAKQEKSVSSYLFSIYLYYFVKKEPNFLWKTYWVCLYLHGQFDS